jgi:uncharacterized protein with NAD-binding domain and iron-sulfur cluster
MKKKIAVIGGGLGAMSAIYHLMHLPNARDLYDITLYQTGWRLGGKGASGVNRDKGFRIEEHGIHFWFGFYENAFHIMQQVYEKLDRPTHAPLATFEDAFKPQPFMDFAQQMGGVWTDWRVGFPTMPGKVGDGVLLNPVEEVIEVGLNILADEFQKISHLLSAGCLGMFLKPFRKTSTRPVHATHEFHLTTFEKNLSSTISHAIERRLRALAVLHKDPKNHHTDFHKAHAEHYFSLRHWIWDELGDLVSKHPTLLRIWCLLDFGLAVMKGIIEDGVLGEKNGQLTLDFTKINHYDFKEWLLLHGADKKYLFNEPVVQSLYDGPFAFFRGAVSTPNVEAGTALNIFMRLAFTCKEAIMWRMQAGMGDVVFTPMYQYFRKAFPDNVHFKFFHKATNLLLSDDKKHIEVLELERQIDLAEGITEYHPFLNVKGLDCFPSEPLYEQLNPEQAAKIKASGIDVCSDWSDWQGTKIRQQRGEDFDDIIIGASLAAIPDFCSDLIKHHARWADMLDKVGTVQTQAFQLWLTKSPEELGSDPLKVLSTYVEPLDTYASMPQALDREDWPPGTPPPKYLLYVCGAMLDSETIPPKQATYFPQSQREEVYQNTLEYVKKHLQFVLPKAYDENGNFDWNILYDPTGGVGEERLRYQYVRSNIDSTERYVFALKGSSKHRLKTDETGLDNLFLTGDWIQNGMNIGFVEGATISGILTARAVSHNPNIPLFLPW